MYKVWYRDRADERLEVEVIADRLGALRRAAAIVTDRSPGRPIFAGIEDADGRQVLMEEFDDYVRSYRAQDANGAVCLKYYVEVQPLPSMRKAPEDEWVRWAIETTRVRADVRAREAGEIFGYDRVQVVGV